MNFESVCSKVCPSHPREWSGQTRHRVETALYLGSMLTAAAVAGSIVGVGAAVGLATGAGYVTLRFLSDQIVPILPNSGLIQVIASLAALYLGFHVGAAVLMMYATTVAKPVALNMTFKIIASTWAAGNLAISANLDLRRIPV